MDFNIDEALENDADFSRGIEDYQKLEKKANDVAEEISSTLVETIVKDSEKFNLSTAILAIAKCFGHLVSYMYDTEDEFLADIKKARTCVVSDIIPTLLDPQPCGKCEECKNGNPHECINPEMRADYTTSRFLPLLCNMLVEYDLFNKVIYMHTAGKENDVATENVSNMVQEHKEEMEEK